MYVFLVLGAVLLLLGVAKAGALAYQLATGVDVPGPVVAKQSVYAAAALVLGVNAVRTGRAERVRS
jgi:hypothetical protein